MKIIQNFSSNKHIQRYPKFDIMLWIVSATYAKRLGYDTKLYCEEKDVAWLKQWGLYDLYDEIDTETLANPPELQNVDSTHFWSIRKMVCINHEMSITPPGQHFAYIDTDVVLFRALELLKPDHTPYDVFVWSPDPFGQTAPIYCDLKYLSMPPGYILPPYFRDANHAWNCGVMFFDKQEVWQTYYQQYLAFVTNNPCTFTAEYRADSEETVRNVWACNAEQRLLAGLADYYNWSVGSVMPEVGQGWSEYGVHYYLIRALWRKVNAGLFDKAPDFIAHLNAFFCDQVRQLLTEERMGEKRQPFLEMPWVQKILNGDNTINYQ